MLTDQQEDLNTAHRKIRARVEHTLARNWKILRDTASGIARLHNLAITG